MSPSIRAAARRSRATRRFAFLASAAAAVLGLGTLAAPALAEPGPGDRDGGARASGLTEYDAGRYVVLLTRPPAASSPQTRAPRGQQLNARSAEVRDYAATLERQQRRIATEVGADILDSFTIAANGFVADLSGEQALDLATDRRVLLVEKDSLHEADTWNTPSFLGLSGSGGAWSAAGGRANAGDGVVVGIIDSGTWPESKSFSGSPLTNRPQGKWGATIDGSATSMRKADGGTFRGQCQTGEQWTLKACTTKLIGARYYVQGYGKSDVLPEDYLSPRDGNGHGTHTASTSGGNVVDDVAVEGRRFGTLSGMAPAARIATYKALWATSDGSASGTTSDLVAAINDAVTDGVDVINYSISGSQDTVLDAVEITFEGAAEAGVFVAASAGNNGPEASTVAHNSPWLTTVAANTHHSFENTVVLGNGTELVGASISDDAVPSSPLVESSAVGAAGASESEARLCGPGSLDPAKVAGTIVVCTRGTYDRVAKSAEVQRAGGVGMVLLNPGPNSLDADFHSVPTVHVPHTAAAAIDGYLQSAGTNATASIELGNLTGEETPVPQVAGFSSRGPAGSDNGDLLKPDISAPGVSILAAVAPPSNSGRGYDLYSGTSMSAPHVAGLAAFLQGLHPDWEPMKIKSAMMTTATDVKNAEGGTETDLFAQGAGQVTPQKFLDPGLFVLSNRDEWRGYITGLGLDTGVPAVAPNALNLPSMAQGYVMSEASFTRRFTATKSGTWRVSVDVPGFDATTSTRRLAAAAGETKPLTIDFQRTDAPLSEWAFGHVTLTGPTTVRLPVALRPVSVKAPTSVGATGATGSVDVPITGGFTGDLAVSTAGLVKGQVAEGALAVGDSTFECVTFSEETDLAQLDLHAPDSTSDLDLYVYTSDSCSTADVTAFAGQAATPAAGETLTLTDPEPGTYLVEVNAYAAGSQGAPVPYSLRVYDVGGSEEAGGLTVTPNPVPVQTGVDTSFRASWSGLETGSHYLGILGYDGSPNSTFLYVDTN